MREDLKEIAYVDTLRNLEAGVNIFPKGTTSAVKYEKIERLLTYAKQTERYKDCQYLSVLLENIKDGKIQNKPTKRK